VIITDDKLKMTNQRRVILDTLNECGFHPTADELYELVRNKLPKISLATIYRNLDALSEAGLVAKLEFAGGQKRFDKTVCDHSHIKCVKCGRVDDIAVSLTENIQSGMIPETDYQIIECRLDFTGICPSCRKKNKK
jgi:Fe2+ or Zn2+ uptake regulation protein